jgi:acetyl-CoA carboxylase biotin carboxyl carrier protein
VRLHAPRIEALAAASDGRIGLRAPGPGWFVPRIGDGELVVAGRVIGALIVLGRASALIAPRGAAGVVVEVASVAHAVGYGEVIATLDPARQLGGEAAAAGPAGAAADEAALVFRAPTSGRFYGRAAPDKPPFVEPGVALVEGTTICLLEVMKTFHRVTYGGAGLPETARVVRVLVDDGDDVNAGDPLIALEPAQGSLAS